MKSKLFKLTAASLLCLCMVFAFAGCGDSSEEETSSDETAPIQSQETEATTTANEEYDISKGLSVQEDGDNLILKGNGFELTMPNTGTWSYVADNKSSLTVYFIPADEAGFGGRLVSINALPMDDNSYEDWPSYAVAGESESLGVRFVAMFPTDVQYDPNDQEQSEEYMTLLNHVEMINGSSAASPFKVL